MSKRTTFRKLEFQKCFTQLHKQRWIICLSLAILTSSQRDDLCLIREKEWRCTECNKWNEVAVLLLILRRSGFSLLGEFPNRSVYSVDSLSSPWPIKADYLNLANCSTIMFLRFKVFLAGLHLDLFKIWMKSKNILHYFFHE